MAETLSMVSMVSFIAAGVCLALTVILWFAFRIPNVIGDLSGRNARKSIERMRKSNENTGRKSYRSSAVNAARSKLTEAMTERQPRKRKAIRRGMRREYYKIRRNKRILRRQQNF